MKTRKNGKNRKIRRDISKSGLNHEADERSKGTGRRRRPQGEFTQVKIIAMFGTFIVKACCLRACPRFVVLLCTTMCPVTTSFAKT